MENNEQNILDKPVIKLVPAGYGKRFINYAVDFLLFAILASFLLIMLSPVFPLAEKIQNKQPVPLEDSLLLQFFYGLYMSIMETVFKGKSVGKFLTGTKAVTITGYAISSQTAFIRGLVRIIPFPFEQLSTFTFSYEPFGLMYPYPWHDRWSRSIVIDEAASILPKS